jgi:hypothetical protein
MPFNYKHTNILFTTLRRKVKKRRATKPGRYRGDIQKQAKSIFEVESNTEMGEYSANNECTHM